MRIVEVQVLSNCRLVMSNVEIFGCGFVWFFGQLDADNRPMAALDWSQNDSVLSWQLTPAS